MNPELMRNFWIELSTRRLFLMFGVLGLFFAASAVGGGDFRAPKQTAETLFYVIVVLWGTRKAAEAVIGEIRDRTWDNQRLSAINAWDMVWGKLFGATFYIWTGGLLCVAVIVAATFAEEGLTNAIYDLFYFLSIGVISHAVALQASLAAARRRTTHSRLDVFLYQLVGLIAAWAVWAVWQTVLPNGWLRASGGPIEEVTWWSQSISAPVFYLTSLAAFFGWSLVGNNQLMRQELQMPVGPIAWVGFLIFMALYSAGFADLAVGDSATLTAVRVAAAYGTLGLLTYLSVFIERKDRVQIRWLGSRLTAGRFDQVLWNLPGWAFAFIGTAIAASWLNIELTGLPEIKAGGETFSRVFLLASLGALARDIGIFLFFHMLPRQRRGDFASIVTLIIIYLVLPVILNGVGLGSFTFVLIPQNPEQASWASVVAAWAAAGVMWSLAFSRASIEPKGEPSAD
jgi:hypothetical protein